MFFGCKEFSITSRKQPLIIAEIGVNHNGDPQIARKMVDSASIAGADIVKFQAFRSRREISRFAECATYQKRNSYEEGQLALCERLELSNDSLVSLRDYCREKKMPYLFTAFEQDSLGFLICDLNLETVKIPSGEITNLPLLEETGQYGVSVILSTGASSLWEVGRAIEVLKKSGAKEIMLFHCVSEYPAPIDQVNLLSIKTMAKAFKLPVGFSDHTIGATAAIAATAIGAVAIEKHFTLDKTLDGPDHQASAEPEELAELVRNVKQAALSIGNGEKIPQPCEMPNMHLIRKGIVVAENLEAGSILDISRLEIKRPAAGIEPCDLHKIIGRTLRRKLSEDEPLTWEDLV